MALVRLPGGEQRSGSAGGIVWSHNAGGPYIRARSVPVNPNTSRQVLVRNAQTNLSNRWAVTLTEVQRNGWEVYAANVSATNALGESINLSGLNWYVGANVLRIQGGLAIVDVAPLIFAQAEAELALTTALSAAAQTIDVGFDNTQPWANETGAFQTVFMGLPKNPGVKFFNGPWRNAGVILGDDTTAPTSPATLAAPFLYGAGQRIWVYTRIERLDARYSFQAQVDGLSVA